MKKKSKNFWKILQKFLTDFWIRFLSTNPLARRVNSFYERYFRPFFVRACLLVIFSFLIFLTFLHFFNPQFLSEIENQTYRKFLTKIYHQKNPLPSIKISGISIISKQEIEQIVDNFFQKHFSSDDQIISTKFIAELARELQAKQPLIQEIQIFHSIPNKLFVKITEFIPFTIWYEDGNKFLIDKNGNFIAFKQEYQDLPHLENKVILSGKNANRQIKSLISLISKNSEIAEKIYSANWVGERRWDLRLNSGLLIKLPEKNLSEAWEDMVKLLKNPQNTEIYAIDLRVKGRIYLQYQDSNSIDKKI